MFSKHLLSLECASIGQLQQQASPSRHCLCLTFCRLCDGDDEGTSVCRRVWWNGDSQCNIQAVVKQYVLTSAVYINSRRRLAAVLTRNSATGDTARVGGHYAFHGHSRSLILVPIESPNATFDYQWIILTGILSESLSDMLTAFRHCSSSMIAIPRPSQNALISWSSRAGLALNYCCPVSYQFKAARVFTLNDRISELQTLLCCLPPPLISLTLPPQRSISPPIFSSCSPTLYSVSPTRCWFLLFTHHLPNKFPV